MTAIGLVVLLFAAEAFYVPLRAFQLSPEPPELYKWLGEQEGDFAVAELPVDPTGYGVFARQVYYSIYHWKKLLVGYSGYQSDENRSRLRRLNETFPEDRCLDELRDLSVRYVIVLEGRLEPEKLEALRSQERLELVHRFDGISVYRFRPAAGEPNNPLRDRRS